MRDDNFWAFDDENPWPEVFYERIWVEFASHSIIVFSENMGEKDPINRLRQVRKRPLGTAREEQSKHFDHTLVV